MVNKSDLRHHHFEGGVRWGMRRGCEGRVGGKGGDSKVVRSSQKTHKESHFSVILRGVRG